MKKNYIISIYLSIFIVFLSRIFVYPYLYANNIGNVIYYCITCVLFVLVYFISDFLLGYYKVSISKPVNRVLSYSGLVLFATWFIAMYFNEPNLYHFFVAYSLRHRVYPWLYLIGVTVCTLLIIFLLFLVKKERSRGRIFFAGIISLIQFCVMLAPNFINDQGGSLFHIHAYFNPIYNSVRMLPFDSLIRSIYGHYSILYFIPVKALSFLGIPEVFSSIVLTALLGAVSFLLVYLALNKLLERDVLYYLSVFSISYISFYTYLSGQYYQLLPHRIVFPAVIIYLFSKDLLKKLPEWIYLIVCSLALVWNIETGFVCLIVVSVYLFIQRVY